MMDYGYAGWTRDENFLKVRMNLKKVFCCWFLLSNGRMSGIFVVFGLATFTDCTPGGLIPEILNTNTNTNSSVSKKTSYS